MRIKFLSKDQIYTICLYSVGIFIKIFVMHRMMELGDNYFLVSLNNIITIVALLCIIFMCRERDIKKTLLLVNILISGIFFIDSMYHSHFFTLTPIHGIYQLGQLGPVSNSVISLIRPGYCLFFLDILILWIFSKKKKLSPVYISLKGKKVLPFFLIAIIIFSSLLTYKTNIDTEGIFTPYNLGAINYHAYDLINFFAKNPLDIDRVEAIMEILDKEEDNNKGFGIAKDRNVIVIQAESLQNFVINKKINDQSITPVLNQLIDKDSIYFSQYYEQVGWGNTSDAEFISHNSFYPSLKTFSYKAFEDNKFYTLPMLLKDQGYSTIAFHGNQGDFWNRENIYPSQGIDKYVSLEQLEGEEMIGIGLSDGSLFEQSIDFLKGIPQPFYSFFITLTSHHPFEIDHKYREIGIQDDYRDTILEDYLQTIHYLDREIGNFIDLLKEEDLYDNSIIVIYGDHEGLDMRDEETNELLTSFLGKPYEEDEMFKIPFIVHIPDSGLKKRVITAGGQIDFFPTMANILGVDLEANKVLGQDLLNTKDGFVAKQVHLTKGSFIDNDKIFIMSNDGVFENSRAWNLLTREAIDIEECREGYERALAEINLSEYILHNDLIPIVQKEGLSYILEME